MFYTRGSKDDYDRWAKVTGDPGWSWNSLLPYFFKVCKYKIVEWFFHIKHKTGLYLTEREIVSSSRQTRHPWAVWPFCPWIQRNDVHEFTWFPQFYWWLGTQSSWAASRSVSFPIRHERRKTSRTGWAYFKSLRFEMPPPTMTSF